jgi:hypothetical protein
LKERQISVEDALQAAEAQAERVVQAEQARRQSNLDDKAFALSFVLKDYAVPEAEAKAIQVQETIDRYPGWPYNQKLEREVRLALYRLLMQPATAGPPQVAEERAEYKVAGQGGSDINRLKELVDNLLRMSDMVGA